MGQTTRRQTEQQTGQPDNQDEQTGQPDKQTDNQTRTEPDQLTS